MSSKDSPPQKRGGATDEQRREQTAGCYETAIERLRETKIPESRQDALVGACDTVQSALVDDEPVSTDDLLVLTAVAAEAINDVREAKTVGTEEDLPVRDVRFLRVRRSGGGCGANVTRKLQLHQPVFAVFTAGIL